jgi:hypothetical protein
MSDHSQAGSNFALYSGGPKFKSQATDQLS